MFVQLLTAAPMDREQLDTHLVNIVCEDEGVIPLSSIELITVSVLDENDNPPVCDKKLYEFSVLENNREGDYVGKIVATDLDARENAKLSYELVQNSNSSSSKSAVDIFTLFNVNAKTGRVTALRSLDYEKLNSFEFLVVVKDSGAEPKSATASVIISVTNVNDNSPTFLHKSYEFKILENNKVSATLGFVEAIDDDLPPYNDFVFSIKSDGGTQFSINPKTGEISALASLDREDKELHTFDVIVNDTLNTAVVPVNILVGDFNDNSPVVRVSQRNVTILYNLTVGSPIAAVTATDADIGPNGVIYHNLTLSNQQFGLFEFNSTHLLLTRDLTLSDVGYYTVQIDTCDSGSPPRCVKTSVGVNVVLQIVTSVIKPTVDKSAAAVATDNDDITQQTTSAQPVISPAPVGGSNFIILIICLVVGVLLVVIIVLQFIFFGRRKHKKRQKAKKPLYIYRIEQQKAVEAATAAAAAENLGYKAEQLSEYDGQGSEVAEVHAGMVKLPSRPPSEADRSHYSPAASLLNEEIYHAEIRPPPRKVNYSFICYIYFII